MSRKVKLIEPERVLVFTRGWLEMERGGPKVTANGYGFSLWRDENVWN